MNGRYKPNIGSDEIYKDLLDKIINLDYEPGEGISENELCEKYGTTRHAIRGALAQLKEKGLVEVFPQRGTYVTLIDLKQLDDILFLRSAVEQEALHVLMKNKDNSALVRKLRECLEQQKTTQNSMPDAAAFYELDDEFHRLLLDAVGRGSVRKLYEDAYLHIRRWRNMEVGALKRIAKLPEEHRDIIDAIEKGNEAQALKCISDHIDSVSQFGAEMKTKYPQFFVA